MRTTKQFLMVIGTSTFGLVVLGIGMALATHSADLTGDGKVDTADLAALKSQWGGTGTADLNHNGIVNTQDAGILFSSWGTLPQPTCNSSTVGTNQLVGCLWDGTNFNTVDGNAASGPALSSPVPTTATALDINWGINGPNTTVGADTFSARWKGQFTFPAGTYTFTGGSDDGLLVRLNGNTKIDKWLDRSYAEDSFSQTFSAQTTVTLEIDFYENGGDARVNFRWMPGTTGTRDPFLWPFDTYSPWNYPIGTGAIYTTIESEIGDWTQRSDLDIYVDTAYHAGLRIYKAKSTDPLRTVRFYGGEGHVYLNADPTAPDYCAENTVVGFTIQIQIPDGIPEPYPKNLIPSSIDAQLIIFDPDGIHMWDLYGAKKAANGADWDVGGISKERVGADGWSGYRCPWRGRASAASVVGGIIRPGELTNGIKHVLFTALGAKIAAGPKWPASSSDGSTPSGNVFESSLLAIPRSVNLDLLSWNTIEGKNMARAMQLYGVYVADGTADIPNMLFGLDNAALSELPYQQRYPDSPFTADLRQAAEHLKVVTNNGPTSIGGGGTPLVPFAPPFAP